MNTNNISQFTDQQTITSMEIAEITGKHHYDVMKAIRKMEPAWESVRQGKFSLTQRATKLPTGGERRDPMYILTKTECLFVATKFNDEARAKLVLRWEQLEKERLTQTNLHSTQNNEYSMQNGEDSTANVPADPRTMSRKQILLMALKAEEENERLRAEKQELEDEKAMMQDDIRGLESDNYGLMIENGQKDEKIKTLEQRTAYLDMIDQSSDTLNTTQIAMSYGMSAVAFNNLLKGLRIQYNSGGQWVLYAPYLSRGYVANRQVEICHSNQKRTYKQITVWTRPGVHFLYDKLKKNGILPLVERTQAHLPAPTQNISTTHVH